MAKVKATPGEITTPHVIMQPIKATSILPIVLPRMPLISSRNHGFIKKIKKLEKSKREKRMLMTPITTEMHPNHFPSELLRLAEGEQPFGS